MRAFWVDRNTNTAKAVDTDGSLEDMYRMCHCDCIDITVISIGKLLFNVVVDDEGLLVEDPMCTVFGQEGELMLFGSVVFFGMDEETDDLCGLDREHMDVLLSRTQMALMSDFTSRVVTIADSMYEYPC